MRIKIIFMFLTMITGITHAVELKEKRTSYLIEFNVENNNMKILSKEYPTKVCDKELRKKETIELIKKSISPKSKKVILRYICSRD